MFRAREFGARIDRSCHALEGDAFGPVAHDNQARLLAFGQGGTCLQQVVDPLAFLEPPHEKHAGLAIEHDGAGRRGVTWGVARPCWGATKILSAGKPDRRIFIRPAAGEVISASKRRRKEVRREFLSLTRVPLCGADRSPQPITGRFLCFIQLTAVGAWTCSVGWLPR